VTCRDLCAILQDFHHRHFIPQNFMIFISAIVFAVASTAAASMLPFNLFVQPNQFVPCFPPVFKMKLNVKSVRKWYETTTSIDQVTIISDGNGSLIWAKNGSVSLLRDKTMYQYEVNGTGATCQFSKSYIEIPEIQLPATTYQDTVFWNGALAEKYTGEFCWSAGSRTSKLDIFVEATTKDFLGFHEERVHRIRYNPSVYINIDIKVVSFETDVRDSEFNFPQMECGSADSRYPLRIPFDFFFKD
jgi:hypothetical protein